MPTKLSKSQAVATGRITHVAGTSRLLVASFIGVAMALAGADLVWTQTREISVERHAVIVAAGDAESERDRLLSAVIEGNCVAAAIPASDVSDASTTDVLAVALDAGSRHAGMASDGDGAGIVDVGEAWLTQSELSAAKEANERVVEVLAKQRGDIDAAIESVRQSNHDKRKSDAKAALEASIASGRGVLESSSGAVDDAKYRDDLSAKEDAAQRVLDANGDDVDAYGSAKADLDTAVKACSDSHDRYVQAARQAAAAKAAASATAAASSKAASSDAYASKQEAQKAAGSSGGTVSQRGDGTWYVSYRGTDSRGAANADGSVSEWEDGYYISHNWSNGGAKIASKPGTVSVNGRTYRYVSSINVPRNTTWQEIESFVHANGGIGFQTCDDRTGGYLITHYEPVG